MSFVTQEGRAGSPQAYLVQIVLQVLSVLLLSTPVVATEMMLPRVYSPEVDVSGWLMSEKLVSVVTGMASSCCPKMATGFILLRLLFVIGRHSLSRVNSGAVVPILRRPCPSSKSNNLIMVGCSLSLPSSMCHKVTVDSSNAWQGRQNGLLKIRLLMRMFSYRPRFAIRTTCSKS